MSRCHSYPPPGYTVKRSNEEAALIESIKLQKEREKAKAERKEEKKRKKEERKREKKEKEKQKLSESADKVQKKDIAADYTVGYLEKKRSLESDQLERSNLTVEYGQAVCSQQNPNTSSDSTENSNKRRRTSSPPNVTRSHGNVIRIRLSTQKQVDSDSSAQNEQICSTSGWVDLPIQRKSETTSNAGADNLRTTLQLPKTTIKEIASVASADNLCSTLHQPKTTIEKNASGASRSKKAEKPMHKDELRFRNLIENWVPPSLTDVGHDDEDWLFKKKQEDTPAKKTRSSSDMLCSASALWPCAQYIPGAEIVALPYTVPY